MLAVYWNEYLTFLSALVGLILILTVVYFIFFRPVYHIKEQALKRPESDRNQEEDHWQ
jgi:large-conductance mechanosensitive channel